MLASWTNVLPVFVVRWLAMRYGEEFKWTLSNGDFVRYRMGPDNVLFYVPKGSK